MKPEELYQNLKNLAEKLGITVVEHNLRISGLKVKSGLCKVKGKDMFIMDKHKTVRNKIEILAFTLSKMSVEDIYIVPNVRKMLDKYVRQDEVKNKED